MAVLVCSESCIEEKKYHEKKCQSYNKGTYIECVQARMKRYSSNCVYQDDCDECNCDECQYSTCGGQCNSCCNSCCSNFVQCHSQHCCHRQCHNECQTLSCRSGCRRSCYENIRVVDTKPERQVLVPGRDSTTKHNITTVINLKNIINNTNFLDIPINLNYTNKNNISILDEDGSSSIYKPSDAGKSGCCVVISPRQCTSTSTYPFLRCFHTRARQCGSFCTSSIVHQERRNICNNINGFPTNCRQQLTYIPQPQPRCVYTTNWPYVSCGVQPPGMSCDGCYGEQNQQDFLKCPPYCYENFNVGPVHQQEMMYPRNMFPESIHPSNPCLYSPESCYFSRFDLGQGMPEVINDSTIQSKGPQDATLQPPNPV